MTARSSRRRRAAFAALSIVSLALAACTSGPASGRGPVIAAGRVVEGTVSPTPIPPRVRLGDVQFVSRTDGFLVRCTQDGNRCPNVLLRTRDAGATWTLASRVVPASFDFVSAARGFGLDGGCRKGTCHARVSVTTDGSRVWSHLRTVTFRPRRGIFGEGRALSFVDTAHGWFALGGRVFRTVDGGATWTELAFACPRSRGTMPGMSFGTATTGYVGCEGEPATDMTSKTLFRTDDGGQTWRVASAIVLGSTQQPDGGRLPAVGGGMRLRFFSADRGVLMAGRLGMERTLDGGRRFRLLLFTDDVDGVVGTSWLSPSLGYVALLQGGLVRTTDGGATWTKVYPIEPPKPVGPVAFASRDVGFGAWTGGFFNDQGAVFATRDGGATWSRVGEIANASIDQLVPVSTTELWAVARAPRLPKNTVRLYRSDDGGRRWARGPTFRAHGTAMLSFPTPVDGFFTTSGGRVSRTADGGKTWSRGSAAMPGYWRMHFVTALEGWASHWGDASSASIQYTSDGGRTWRAVSLQIPGFEPESFTFLNRSTGWISGPYCSSPESPAPDGARRCGPGTTAAILRTGDGGRTWTMITLPSSVGDQTLDFVSPRIGFALGGDGWYRTTDGGVSWGPLAG